MSRRGGGDDDRSQRRQHHAGSVPALDLLDEYWFFSNTLVRNNSARTRKPPPLPSSRCDGRISKDRRERGEELYGCGRRLLRTPSLPSPRVGMMPKDEEVVEEEEAAGAEQQQQQEVEVVVDDDDLNWSSIYEGVLRTRIAERGGSRSALQRAPSMPVPSSATDDGRQQTTKSTPSMPRLRHSYSTLERHCRSHTPTAKAEQTSGARARRSKSAFQDPDSKSKSKSSSDLESMEVQGFKDLGFVFDKEELRESLADVLPGLRGNASSTTRGRRPEAWRWPAAPALMRVRQSDAAEMKDQLRMWAQAVACNVRQEC